MYTREVEKQIGINKETLRYYEKEGLINPIRDENGYRNYTPEDLERISLILQFREMQITIDEIKLIFAGDLNLNDCLTTKEIKTAGAIQDLKEVKKVIRKVQKDKEPLLLAIEKTDQILIGERKNGYYLDNIQQQLTLHRYLSFYEHVFKHEKKRIMIKYQDIACITVTYGVHFQGLWGNHYAVILNAKTVNDEVYSFHGLIEADKYDFLLAIGIMKKAQLKIIDKYGIIEALASSD